MGRAKEELGEFPRESLRLAGYNLGLVQQGEDPEDWKPLETVGPGVREIRIRVHDGGATQFRVVYIARFAEAVYVLHAFQKRTEATPRRNLDIARARYSQLLRDRERESILRKRR